MGEDCRMHPSMAPAFSPLLAILAAEPPVTVDGASCLDAADVEVALQGLLPAHAPRGSIAIELVPSADSLVVRVRDHDGELIAERALAPLASDQVSCRQRAQEIAVVIAASVVPEGLAPRPVGRSVEPPAPRALLVTPVAATPPRAPRRVFAVGGTARGPAC